MHAREDFRTQTEPACLQDREPFCYILIVELNNQDGETRVDIEFHQISCRLKMQLSFCLIEQWPVNVLDRRRFQVEQLDRCLHRVVDGREKNQAEPFLGGQGRNFELG